MMNYCRYCLTNVTLYTAYTLVFVTGLVVYVYLIPQFNLPVSVVPTSSI